MSNQLSTCQYFSDSLILAKREGIPYDVGVVNLIQKKFGTIFFILQGKKKCLFVCLDHAATQIGSLKTSIECHR